MGGGSIGQCLLWGIDHFRFSANWESNCLHRISNSLSFFGVNAVAKMLGLLAQGHFCKVVL
jgi:hypothetical protein